MTLTTTLFRLPGTDLSEAMSGHYDGCNYVGRMLAGLYAQAGCNCRLDSAAPAKFYPVCLTRDEAEVVFDDHFGSYCVQGEPDPGEIAWTECDWELTDEAVAEQVAAMRTGMYDWFEMWRTPDGADNSLVAIWGFVSHNPLDPDDSAATAYLIVTVSDGPVDEAMFMASPATPPMSPPATVLLSERWLG